MTEGDEHKVFTADMVFKDEHDAMMIEEALKETFPDLELVEVAEL